MLLVDEFTKENLALEVDRRSESGDVITVLDKAGINSGTPYFSRSDTGPEFVAKKVCRWIQERGSSTAFIPPVASWETTYIESFNSRLRHDLLDVQEIGSLVEAKWLAKDHHRKYKQILSHCHLSYATPAKIADLFGSAPAYGFCCAKQQNIPNNQPNLP